MTMIERVARAIEAVNRTPESSAHTQRISTPEEAAEYYRTLARAAIAEMREPDYAMVRASEREAGLPYTTVYRSMIEAALAEPQGPPAIADRQ